ncbi:MULTISPECIES: hypothetical protein [Halobellus]|uniref:Uncharacterized protein n=1 Tax=Halobellus clavatus TaxID=660517 RepID=A0A1H3IXM8_9EURY|nr:MULTISPECIES: hypothetical protein [Halobellus]SDY32451.1 hypothetical protein SAMN04487946_11156 [Halobellus clavatus]
MTTIVITLKDGKISTDGGIDVSSSQSTAPTTDSHNINRHLDLDTVVDLVEQMSEDEICARQSTKYPNWSRGDPCPVCENTELAIMELREATYTSSDGEFDFDHFTDNTGPQLSIVCKECRTHLLHIPYHTLSE